MAKQQRAAETRASIISGAAQIFADNGYASTSLKDIVSAAHVTQGALYFHFGSKAELAAEVIRLQHERSIAVGLSHIDDESSGVAGMILLSGSLAYQIQTDAVVRAGLRLSTEAVDELASAAQLPYAVWAATARLFLEKARALGETRPNLDLDAASEVVSAAFTGTQFISVAMTGGADLESRLARMWLVVLPALTADSETTSNWNPAKLIRTAMTHPGNESGRQ